MFERLGSLTYRLRFLIVVAWVVAAVLCARFAPSLAGQGSTDQASFLPSGTPSVQARDALEKAFPGSTSASSATLTFERATGLTDADLAYLDAVAAWVAGADAPAELRAAVTSTDSATSRPELAKMLRSDDGRLELLVVNLDVQTAGDAAALVVDQLRDHLVATGPDHPGLETHVTGAAAISSDYLAAVRAGTESTTVVTVLLVIAVLLLIYRAPLAALVPLVTIGGAFVVSRGVLGFLAAAGWQVSSLLDTFLVVMVFGVGTDYAIFLISRYREEVAGGGDWHGAARSTVKRIGAVISASAATVIVGMTAMAFGDFQMIQSTGPALGVAIFVTLVAGLTLAPALLSIFGHYLFWPLHARPRPEGEPGGLFARLASAVSRRPGLVTVVLLAALLVPATYLPQVRTNFDVLAELPAKADSRLGYDAIARRLGEDKLVQSTGIVDAGGGGDMLAPASLARLRDLMATLSSTPGVATATSLVTPDGDGVVPDGFRPSAQLAKIASDLEGDDANASGDSTSLLDDTVSDGLDSALAYVDGLAVAFPDVAASPELRAVTSGIGDAQDIVARARRQSLLPTQLRTLASALTSPTSAAMGSGSADSSASMMADYLDELAAAYPEVKALPAFRDATAAAARLERKAALQPALDLSAALETIAVHFDGRPDATLSPTSLSGTASARELRREAQATFDALPDRFAALAAVFAPRPDDIWIPTTLTGEDGRKVRDAVDAFVSGDRGAMRFYLTSASDPYSGDAFAIVRAAQAGVSAAAPSFGAGAAGFLGGPTAQFADVQSTLSSDFERVGVITVIGILLVLMLLLRAVVAPLYLVATVLVSYASAVGLSSWLFQEVLGQPGISFYLPLMVFVLLVALGSDYNIFLMSRVREESETRPIRDGIRIASGHTGAVITSAGLILAGTFGSMATAPLAVLFQVGVAVAIGVLIDTFVVRSILVPAITTLVGDRAWWPSGAALAGLLRPVPAGFAPGSVALIGSVADGTGGSGGQRRSGGPVGAGRASWGRLAVALCLVVLVPVVAAGVLTWSFGHAASGAGGQTAAVVSLDSGATLTAPDGASETLRLGSDLVDELTAPAGGSGLAWVGADEGEAAAGLADGRYAAVLTIPADFSRTIAALRSDTSGRAARATLRLQGAAAASGRAGSLPGAVARDVMAAIDATAGRGVTASYVEDVLLAVSDAHDQVAGAASKAGDVADATRHLSTGSRGLAEVAGQVASGLGTLADGAAEAKGGTDRLVAGIRALASGAGQVAGGATDLASGTRAAARGAARLSDGAAALSDGATALDASVQPLPAQAAELAGGVSDVAAGATKVASGATKLADGLSKMRKDTSGLGDRATALDAGAADVDAGAAHVADGARQADAAAGQLAARAGDLAASVADYTAAVDALSASCATLGGTDPLCSQLAAVAASSAALDGGADGISSGARGLAASTGDLASGAADVADGAAKVHAGTSQLASSAPELEAGIVASASGASDLADGASKTAAGASAAAGGAAALAAGMPALASGVDQVSTGATGVASGTASLAGGLRDLSAGAGQLADGAGTAADGARALARGASGAAGGASALTGALDLAAQSARLVEAEAGGLADDGGALDADAGALAAELRQAADGIRSYAAETRARMGALAADPIAVEGLGGGTDQDGLAALLLGLATWLAALGAFLVLPATWSMPGRRWWRGPLAAFLAAAGVTALAALLAVAVVHGLVGVNVANLPELVLAAGLAAVTFAAIIQALVTHLGNRGWLLGLLLLVVQAAAAGLPYPVATMPGPIAAIHPLLPLSYAVDWMHAAITGATGTPVGVDAVVLAAWLVVGLLVTLAAVAGTRRTEVVTPAPA